VSAVAVDPAAARVLVADQSGGITILDARSLRPVGSLAGSGIASQIAIDSVRGRAFVFNSSVGTVTTVDTRHGTLLGVASVGSGASAIQVDEHTGHVFVESTGLSGFSFWRTGNQVAGPSAGTVAMLDAASGKLLRTITVGTLPFSAALDDQHHELFVSSFGADSTTVSGAVQVIDTASGRVTRTIAVPAGPISLTLDQSRGHVVVAGLGDDSQLPGPWSGAVERVVQFFGLAGSATVQSGPGAVTILKTAH
jgi:DNA-binding beta-propeller fold protein YncE